MSDFGWKYLTRKDRAMILEGIREGKAVGGPFHAEIHPADRCNIECFFCSTAAIRGTDEIPMPRLEELIGELKAAGTRSIRLSGGGEPLFHRSIKRFLQVVAESGIPIENLTTNAVLLGPEIAELLTRTCDSVVVSLNTVGADSWGSMMQSPPRNYERVLQNIRGLVAAKKKARSRRPEIVLQFLVWKENYQRIPEMFSLALELEVDKILFNGLSFLPPEKRMTPEETEEMIRLYEEVVRVDEFRKIASIESYEQDIHKEIAGIRRRVGSARGSLPRRLATFLKRRDVSWRDKIAHHLRERKTNRILRETKGMSDYCVIGWHSLVIRSSGEVGACCILQGKPLGNVFQRSLAEVWRGPAYEAYRNELSRVMREGNAWSHDREKDQTVEELCGLRGDCPIRSFYYRSDIPFIRSLNEMAGIRGHEGR